MHEHCNNAGGQQRARRPILVLSAGREEGQVRSRDCPWSANVEDWPSCHWRSFIHHVKYKPTPAPFTEFNTRSSPLNINHLPISRGELRAGWPRLRVSCGKVKKKTLKGTCLWRNEAVYGRSICLFSWKYTFVHHGRGLYCNKRETFC